MKQVGRKKLGIALITLAVTLFIMGAKNVVSIEGLTLLGPTDILPLILCIAVPSVLFLFGGIAAFKGQLTLSCKSQD